VSAAIDYPFAWDPPLEPPDSWRDLTSTPVLEVRLPFGADALLVTRHHDIVSLLADRRLGRLSEETMRAPRSDDADEPGPTYADNQRGLVNKAFSPRRVELLRPLAENIVAELLDRMADGPQPADLKEAFAYPLPMRMICHLLGIPLSDEAWFRGLVDDFLSVTKLPAEELAKARDGLDEYLGDLIERKVKSPADDLTSELVCISEAEPARMSRKDLLRWLRSILVAGYTSTAEQISASTVMLLSRPEVLSEIRRDWSVVPSAVEELLRYQLVASSLGFIRVALDDVALADGTVIPRGSTVMMSIEANMDASAFPEPRKLDVHRQNNKHLTFGAGIHFCLGAALARVELQTATAGLLRRFPGLRLAVPGAEIPRSNDMFFNGFTEVLVTW